MFCIPHDKLINGKWRHEIDQPQCEGNVVPGTCKTKYECEKGMTCYNAKCLQSCTQENDCPLGQYCHSKHKVCHEFCKSDEECSIGYVCYESKCVDRNFVTMNECPRGMACYNQKCLKSCNQDNDCGARQYCHDNHKVCHDFCLSNQACSVGYVCSDSKCVDKTSNPVPSKCLTISGQDSDSPCTFPFTYQGYKFSTCTKMDWDIAWCSTQVDDRGNYIPNNWGNCGCDCPIESTIVY